MGAGGFQVMNLCSYSGIMKTIQTVFIFITMLLHRTGDNGFYIFFATTSLKLSNTDTNIDVENLGNATLVSFLVINIVLILGYIFDGVEEVQDSLLEGSFNFLAMCMFFATGVTTILTWKDEQIIKTSSSLSESEFTRNVTAALAMAGLCIFIGTLYLVDVLVGWFTSSRRKQQYRNP